MGTEVMPSEKNGNVVFLSQATLILTGKGQQKAAASIGGANNPMTTSCESLVEESVTMTTNTTHSTTSNNITTATPYSNSPAPTDENENVSLESSESSDSDLASESEDMPITSTYNSIPAAKKPNKYHPLNWYTPTVLSPILDVSPSLESREAENTNTASSATTSKTIGSNFLDDDETDSEVPVISISTDGRDPEAAGDYDSLAASCTKLKRSPAIIDFSEQAKMSRSTGDLPEIQEESVIIEDSTTSTTDQSISLMTKSETALGDPGNYGETDDHHGTDAYQEIHQSASSTNLLFDEISVPFYFTLPAAMIFESKKKESASMDDSLHRPKHKQSRLSLVMSQVLLKEELKEALCLQRSKLTECEIEADERAEKVQKKLSEQSRRGRKGSIGSRKVHALPDKHIYDGRWCSEPSLINDKAVSKRASNASDAYNVLNAPNTLDGPNASNKLITVSVQTDPIIDLSQLGRTISTATGVSSSGHQFTSGKSSSKEVKRVKSGKSKRKATVAINTQITWRALQVPTSMKGSDKCRSVSSSSQSVSGIAYNDLLDFSSKPSRRCAYCNGGSNGNYDASKTVSNVSRDVLYEYFQSTNPRRVTLFNDYNHKPSIRSSKASHGGDSRSFRHPSQNKTVTYSTQYNGAPEQPNYSRFNFC